MIGRAVGVLSILGVPLRVVGGGGDGGAKPALSCRTSSGSVPMEP